MQLNEACSQAGITPRSVPLDDNWHTTGIADKARSDAGRILLFSDGSGGMVYNWISCESVVFWYDDGTTKLSAKEARERDRKREEAINKANADRDMRYAMAARLAQSIYENGTPAKADHPYLTRKQITPTATMVEMHIDALADAIGYRPKAKDTPLEGRILIIPVVDEAITTLEFIDENGIKSALAGGRKKGAYWQTGSTLRDKPLFIAEGVATAISVSMATGAPCAAVLSSSGFASCVPKIRKKYPFLDIVICADIGNGYEKADVAARENGLPCVSPAVEIGSDFNDMAVESGLDPVKELIYNAIPKAKPHFMLASDMIRNIPDHIAWQVEGMAERGSTVCIFGASEQGKSFIIADLALCIATGKPFAGHEVERGNVLILVGEGKNGFLRRLQSWCDHHGIPTDSLTNIYISTIALDIYNVIDLPDVPITAIFCDTLAQHYSGNENDASDMMKFVERMDIIRMRYDNATSYLVHHSGTSTADRVRGSTALRASLDAEYRVLDGVMTCTKMKDFEHPKPLNFRIQSEGKSARVIWNDIADVALTDNAVSCIRALVRCVRSAGGKNNGVQESILRAEAYGLLTCKNDQKRHYYSRGLKEITENSCCRIEDGLYFLTRPQDIEISSILWI